MPMMTKSSGHGARGSSLVELALTLPLLALLLFSIIQYGFIFAGFITVRNASAVGARHAILRPAPSDAEVRQAVRDAMSPMLQTTSGNPVINISTVCVGTRCDAKQVEVVYTLNLLIPFVVPGKNPGGDSISLRAVTIMR
jgi:Flp pilus assembly protein TadG